MVLLTPPLTGELEILRKELEKESASKSEVQTKLQESENSLKTIQTKSKQLISKMQERLEEMDKRKVIAF